MALANEASAPDISVVSDPKVLRAKLALSESEIVDVSVEVSNLINGLSKSRDVKRDMIKAFWAEHAKSLALCGVKSRLFVNPPGGLNIEATTFCQTLETSSLGGNYGTKYTSNPLSRATIPGDWTGCFDDVAVFWDRWLDSGAFISSLFPTSTVTFARPDPKIHGFWLSWGELDLSFKTTVSAIKSEFSTKILHRVSSGGVETLVIGLESKV